MKETRLVPLTEEESNKLWIREAELTEKEEQMIEIVEMAHKEGVLEASKAYEVSRTTVYHYVRYKWSIAEGKPYPASSSSNSTRMSATQRHNVVVKLLNEVLSKLEG